MIRESITMTEQTGDESWMEDGVKGFNTKRTPNHDIPYDDQCLHCQGWGTVANYAAKAMMGCRYCNETGLKSNSEGRSSRQQGESHA